VTFQYGRTEDGWHPIKTSHFLSAGRSGAIGDPNFMRLQPHNVDKRPASGHFGSWTVCTESFAPLRVEAHDANGVLQGVADEAHPILRL
jgi:hypothetical protein